jgi:hypothetical protein
MLVITFLTIRILLLLLFLQSHTADVFSFISAMVMCENVTEIKWKYVPMKPPYSDQLIPGHDLTKMLRPSGSLLSIRPGHSGKLKRAE